MASGITKLMNNIPGPQPKMFHDSLRDETYVNLARDTSLSKKARKKNRRGRNV